jgi:hypothetical protein
MLVLLGDGVGLVGFEPVAPEGVTVVGGAEVGTAAQLASTAVIISAQLTGSARRSPLARRTAPRPPVGYTARACWRLKQSGH